MTNFAREYSGFKIQAIKAWIKKDSIMADVEYINLADNIVGVITPGDRYKESGAEELDKSKVVLLRQTEFYDKDSNILWEHDMVSVSLPDDDFNEGSRVGVIRMGSGGWEIAYREQDSITLISKDMEEYMSRVCSWFEMSDSIGEEQIWKKF